jgi:hypothetical protein
MKTLKILVAMLSGLLAFNAANAGELTVSGSMQATYSEAIDKDTGNPLGLNTDLVFSGSTEILDGNTVTWTMATDGTFLGDSGADHKMSIATSLGTFSVGNSGDSADAVDDITPSAFEEANGANSGTYTIDFGNYNDGSMSVGYSNADLFGTGISVNANYYPKKDGTTLNEKGYSGGTGGASSSATTANISTTLAKLPLIGDTALGGLKITAGYEQMDAIVNTYQDQLGGTVAATYAMGPVSLGYQKKAYQRAQSSLGAKEFYKDDVYGIAYAVNENFAISYNIYQSTKHNNSVNNVEQESKGISIAYTVGGLTIGFQDATTSNDGYTLAKDDDTRTFSLKTAF